MTDKERYDVILGELAELLKRKNDTILWQELQIESLRKQLELAEKHTETPTTLEVR